MINKRSRKTSAPVEQMKQYGFNAAKGINTTASADSTGHVLMLKNLEIEPDGSLKLRKPLIPRFTIPEVIVDEQTVPTEVICSKYMYDNKHMFIVRKAEDGTQYVGIFEGTVSKTFQLTIQSWYDYTEHVLYPYSEGTSGYIALPYLDFTNVDLKNSANGSILTGVLVDIKNPYFKITDYTEEVGATELFLPTLYELTDETFWKPRTLNITKPDYITNDFDCKIFTPVTTELTPSEDVPLNINLDTDNPYAIRDVYNSPLSTLTGVLAYVPTVNRGSKIQILNNFNNLAPTSKEYFEDLYNDGSLAEDFKVIPFVSPVTIAQGTDLRGYVGISYAEVIDMPEDSEALYLKITYVKDIFPDATESPTNYYIHKSAISELGTPRFRFSFYGTLYTSVSDGRSYTRKISTPYMYDYGEFVSVEYTPDGYLKNAIWKFKRVIDLGEYDNYTYTNGYTITPADWASILKNKFMSSMLNENLFFKTYRNSYFENLDISSYVKIDSEIKASVHYVLSDVYGIESENVFRSATNFRIYLNDKISEPYNESPEFNFLM